MNNTELELLKIIADMEGTPDGAYNIRANSELASRHVTENVDIVTKTDKPGIDIIIKPGTKGEKVHIPVIISQTGLKELVYNDFYIGDDCDVEIVAGCGIHNCGDEESRHDGVHTFFEPEAQISGEPSRIDADGIATTRPGLALMVKTADCQPILIAHESGRYVMALHSGWRGNRQDYPRLAVLEFCERYGLDPAELWAVRGPSLGPAASEFTNFEAEWGAEFQRWYDGRNMDLWTMARDQLASAGLLPRRILGLDICTYANCGEYFSYRQFCRNSLADGRQASLIWIR